MYIRLPKVSVDLRGVITYQYQKKNYQIKIRSNNIFYPSNTDPKPVKLKLLCDYNIIMKINYFIFWYNLSIIGTYYWPTIIL